MAQSPIAEKQRPEGEQVAEDWSQSDSKRLEIVCDALSEEVKERKTIIRAITAVENHLQRIEHINNGAEKLMDDAIEDAQRVMLECRYAAVLLPTIREINV